MISEQQLIAKAFEELIDRVTPEWPEARSVIAELLAERKNNDSRWGLLALIEILERYGVPAIAKGLDFRRNYGDLQYREFELLGQLWRDGNDAVVDQTVAFVEKHRISGFHNRFGNLLGGIHRFGEAELEAGMDLLASEIDEDSTGLDPELAARLLRSQRERAAYVTAYLGLATVERLIAEFQQDGFSQRQVNHFLWQIAPIPHVGGCGLGEGLVRQAIQLVKTAGLIPVDFAEDVIRAMENRYGTPAEILEILRLAKQYDLTAFKGYDLENALRALRMPSYHAMLHEAFAKKSPGSLTRAFQFLWLYSVLVAAPAVSAWMSQEQTATEARLRTQELMARHYDRVRMASFERPLVMALAGNPLLTPEMIRRRQRSSTNLDQLRAQVEQRFGIERVRRAMALASPETETEFWLALAAVGPRKLIELVGRLDSELRVYVVRSLNWYGWEAACQAVGLVDQARLEPTLILPTAQGLCQRANGIVRVTPAATVPITPEQETELKTYLGWPLELQRRYARSIKLFRRVQETMYVRIRYGRVTKPD